MKGDRYQPTASIREVRIGTLTIGPEGVVAATDHEAAMFDVSPALVITQPAAAAVAKKPRKPRTRKAVTA